MTSSRPQTPVLVVFLAHLITRCETGGYCRFPAFLWQPVQHGGDDGDSETMYRKWFSRTEYTRNTNTWTRQKEIHARETEIVIYQRFYASCSGYEPPGEVPCFRQTRETRYICVAEEPENKYRVQVVNEGSTPTFTCLRFVRRTNYITQLFSAVPNEVNVDKLCYDMALQRKEWPWIDILHAPVIPCPVAGGFDFRAYSGDVRMAKCPNEWRPSRLESECIPGEGLKLTFPSPECSFMYQVATDQTLVCRGAWTEESYQYIILSDVGGPPRYILRLPSDLDRHPPPIFAHLYFSLVVPASGRGQPPGLTQYVELRMTRSDSCYDESPKCTKFAEEGRCTDSPMYANHCKLSCGYCDVAAQSVLSECQFPSYYQGNWTLVTPTRFEHVSIRLGTLVSSSLGEFVCKSKHWDKEYYKVLSVYPNGCRPRYSCFQILPSGSDMIQLRLSGSSLEDQSFDICQFQASSPPWQTTMLDHELKSLFNQESLHLNFCGLGGIFHTNVSFSDGAACEGTMSDVDDVTCRFHQQLRLKFHACSNADILDYICVAFTQLPQGTSFLVTRSVLMDTLNQYHCWIIKQGDPTKSRRNPTKLLQFNRAKCSTAMIIAPQAHHRSIVSMETFNDFVETGCDTFHGAMERLLQGSTGQSSVSDPPYRIEDEPYPAGSHDSRSRDEIDDYEERAAVKRTTISGSAKPVHELNSYIYYLTLWTVFSLHSSLH